MVDRININAVDHRGLLCLESLSLIYYTDSYQALSLRLFMEHSSESTREAVISVTNNTPSHKQLSMGEEARRTAAECSMDDNPRELYIHVVFCRNSTFYADLITIANFRTGQDVMDKLHTYYGTSSGRFSRFIKAVVMTLKMRHVAIDVVSASTVRLLHWAIWFPECSIFAVRPRRY
jgi:hypothetical protein